VGKADELMFLMPHGTYPARELSFRLLLPTSHLYTVHRQIRPVRKTGNVCRTAHRPKLGGRSTSSMSRYHPLVEARTPGIGAASMPCAAESDSVADTKAGTFQRGSSNWRCSAAVAKWYNMRADGFALSDRIAEDCCGNI
jgi:hypothetical protein